MQLLVCLCVLLLVACTNPADNRAAKSNDPYEPKPYVTLKHPDWVKSAVLYQLNTRQFTPEGTLRAAEKHLPRIKALGATIIWLMPIHPIGVKNRKGSLGSPYSVRDYYGVNAELGTMDDLKHFVAEAHGLGLYVILDWVANHTAWDNKLATEHPDWYDKDYKGENRPTPWWDWSDIIDLDYTKPRLRRYMTDAMKFWVREAAVDGYRCDVAGFVPVDFWNQVRSELDAIRPVFMLAEWESRDLHAAAFDATYAWSWNEYMHKICTGKADVNALYIYYSWNESSFPKEALRMTFTSNHDKNAWEGTMWEQFGDGAEAAVVLSVVGEGIPLIYGSQEAGEPKRLPFFEKDSIQWTPHPMNELFKKSFALLHQNSALWHAQWGATMIKVPNNTETEVLSFVRQNEKDKVFAVFNLTGKPKTIRFKETLYHGSYTDYFEGKAVSCDSAFALNLPAWGYKVFVK